MVSTAIQLYTLRGMDVDLPEMLSLVGETSFEGVEFANRVEASDDPAAVRSALEATDLEPAGAHVGLGDLETDLEATAEFYRSLGCEAVTVPYADPEHFESRPAVHAFGERLDALAADLADAGLALHYHNHTHELVDLGGTTALDELVACTERVGVQPDVAWVHAGGRDPVDFCRTHADRIDQVHVADTTAGGDPAEVGEGEVDLEGVARAAAGADWWIYEHDLPDDERTSLEHGARTLSELRAGVAERVE